MAFQPTDQQIRDVFKNSMQYEILFTFGVPEYHPADYCQWEFINFSRMAHARLLYLFFQTPAAKRGLDDVVSEDFNFAHTPDLLASADRERLNKDLLHFSYKRLRHSPQEKKWPHHILGNLLAPTLKFMRHIRDSRPDLFAAPVEKFYWDAILSVLESGRVLKVAAFTLQHNQSYILYPGELLPDGRPQFTDHYEIS